MHNEPFQVISQKTVVRCPCNAQLIILMLLVAHNNFINYYYYYYYY